MYKDYILLRYCENALVGYFSCWVGSVNHVTRLLPNSEPFRQQSVDRTEASAVFRYYSINNCATRFSVQSVTLLRKAVCEIYNTMCVHALFNVG